MAFYLDTSALVKILHEEPESPAFRSWIRNNTQHCYTSDLTRVELMRAAGRLGAEKRTKARMILQALTLIRISSQICDVAVKSWLVVYLCSRIMIVILWFRY